MATMLSSRYRTQNILIYGTVSDETIHPPEPLDPHRADAIHRALLTGLLGSVGTRVTESHEYTGARNTKFSIFPGSSLFKKRPPWVMSAELVETTKLYARTNAPVRPEWIERAAQHLVHRTYFEPHWQRKTAHVVAFEKVTLYGLVLVPKRLVHYGPIDPVASRRMFIEHALIDGDFRTDAEWYKHNRTLVKHVERLEAKARRRDLLAEPEAQYAFYDARVPPDVFNGPLFDKWRKHVERGRPTLLFMHERDLLKRPVDEITPEKYPDAINVGDMTLPLTYRFEPGDFADGITVSVPLAGLNQVRAERFEWLIPGWLEEKILALIRALPKALRTNFIPAPEHATRAAATIKPGDGSLLDALAIYLGKISGATIRPGSFELASVPAHLFFRFEVLDEAGKVIAAGRDLAEIRRELGVRAQADLGKLIDSPWNRQDVKQWDFGDLPDRVEIARHGITLHAYPALVDLHLTPSPGTQGEGGGEGSSIANRKSQIPNHQMHPLPNPLPGYRERELKRRPQDEKSPVALRLFESPEAAAAAHRAGVRRLFLMQLGEDVKNLGRHVRNLEEASIYYAALDDLARGRVSESGHSLRDDVLTAAADRALYSEGGDVRTREAFVEHARSGWRKLLTAANEISAIVLETLKELAAVKQLMDLPFAPAWRDAFVDVRRQLAELLPRGFVIQTPPSWLEHLPRFVRGVRVRLEKLRDSGYQRDLAGLVQIGPMFQQYLERRAEHQNSGIVDPELEKFRWMLEELRISLFAQELKTSMTISVQRLDRQWALVRDS